MIIVAIDGSSRRNGKPDCLSLGSVFIKLPDGTSKILTSFEKGSTNQRGELMALRQGIYEGFVLAKRYDSEVFLVTDSEYVFNTVNKEWYKSWERKGWITSLGGPVKNRDMWERAANSLAYYENEGIGLAPYHIKGHIVPYGKVGAANLLKQDPTGAAMYQAVKHKLEEDIWFSKHDKIQEAMELFERNHGFRPPVDSFKEMVICNTVADLAAGYHIDIVDAAWVR